MTIRFKKGKEDVHTLICTRKDGSTTWSKIKGEYGPAHDLAHYVIETALDSTGGFYGLLMQGYDISAFEEKGDRSWVGEEGIYVECVVMGLQYVASGVTGHDGFNGLVEDACEKQGIKPSHQFTTHQVDAFVARYEEHLAVWRSLEIGETLMLNFPVPALVIVA